MAKNMFLVFKSLTLIFLAFSYHVPFVKVGAFVPLKARSPEYTEVGRKVTSNIQFATTSRYVIVYYAEENKYRIPTII